MLATTITINKRNNNTAYISFWLKDPANPNVKEMKVVDVPHEKLDNIISAIQTYKNQM
jgi:hypothetical protein